MAERSPASLEEQARKLLEDLVAIDTTNLEDPGNGRMEKRNYLRAAQYISARGKDLGLGARVWDAREELKDGKDRFAEPRPNVVIDLDRGRSQTLLILAHFDVVPVPEEQLERWKSPPHSLRLREDGRYYGRGAADDIGSGVVPGLLALDALRRRSDLPVNVRFIACCDEETGGTGGIEALREHDDALPRDSPERILTAEMALIPDGSPFVGAGSSGVSFVDVSLTQGTRVTEYLRVADALADFHSIASTWTSALPSPPEPEGKPPNAYILGRATPTLEHLDVREGHGKGARLVRIHSNSLAANQIPASVSLTFAGSGPELQALRTFLSGTVRVPYRLTFTETPATLTVQVVGVSGHGGYPHRARNPVPESTRLLLDGLQQGILAEGEVAAGTMTLDLRSPPEMEAEQALAIFRNYFLRLENEVPGATAVVPPGRERSGYFVSPQNPRILLLQKTYEEVAGRPIGIYGEYGGTDASALRKIQTPKGDPLPVVVLGAMDPPAHIHDAEESIDPRYLNEVTRLLVRWVETFG
jgi:acetylornithine deacetylase/succinyl-diaminopimelate desuccinylase-like protein